MLGDIERAKIVITNYHAFKLRETLELSKVGRALLQGRGPDAADPGDRRPDAPAGHAGPDGHEEHPVLNDEAHHCYREKPGRTKRTTSRATTSKEAKKNNEAARLWISGIEAVKRKLGVQRGLRPLGHALLPARLRLRRRHALPVDGQRLLADGRHRVRHRQAAARAGGRQRPRRRHAQVPQSLGAHRQEDAQEGPGQGSQDARSAQPAGRTADRARRPLRPLREDLRPVGRRQASACRRSSSSSATTPPPPSWSTTTSPASTARTTTARRQLDQRTPARCSATTTSTATGSPARARC